MKWKWWYYPLAIINIPLLFIILIRFKWNYDRAQDYIERMSGK